MKNRKAILTVAALMLFATSLFAQEQVPDSLFLKYQKIFVVAGVLVIIFLGILAFLAFLERRLTKLEKESDLKS
jgi:CcmD family protein